MTHSKWEPRLITTPLTRLESWTPRLVRVLGAAVICYAFLAQSYHGRQDIVRGDRANCVQLVHGRVLAINGFRAVELGDEQVANEADVPSAVVASRAADAATLSVTLYGLDLLVDPSHDAFMLPHRTRVVLNPVDAAQVWLLTRSGRAYGCRRANPGASFRLW